MAAMDRKTSRKYECWMDRCSSQDALSRALTRAALGCIQQHSENIREPLEMLRDQYDADSGQYGAVGKIKKMSEYDMLNKLPDDPDDRQFTSELAALAKTAPPAVMMQAKKMMGMMVDYKELRMMYVCAMKAIKTKFDILDTEFNIRYQRNPISSFHTRLKSSASVIDKLNRRGIPFSLDNLETYIDDMAGIRVICSYIDDIYALADALIQQDDITFIAKKDYIAVPKPNGYRSLHLIVSIPVFFADQRKDIKVEVQIRTIAMDFWASLEHQLKYKKDIPDQQNVVAQLKQCADTIASVDEQMMDIRQHLEKASDAPTEDEILLQKLMRLDTPLM